MKETFKIPPRKKKYSNCSNGEVIRISADAYNVLVEMTGESTLPISKIASMAIIYAYENLEFEEEE